MSNVVVAPSILAADFLHLDEEVLRMKNAGLNYLHFDVMDGKFVNNKTFDMTLLKSLKNKFDFVYDVHLMVVNPEEVYKEYIAAGANILTFHYEAMNSDEEVFDLIKNIKKLGCKAGISIKPSTNVNKIEKFLKDLDLVLVMSVEPGFGGQSFIESSLDKILFLKTYKKDNNLSYFICVDGGINAKTAPSVVKAGADILISGTYLFKSTKLKEDIFNLTN